MEKITKNIIEQGKYSKTVLIPSKWIDALGIDKKVRLELRKDHIRVEKG